MQAPLTVTGSKGSVHLPNFVVSGWDPRVIVDLAGQKRVEHLPSISTYTYQLLAFADAVDLGKPVKTDAKDALIQAQLIDLAYEAAGLPLRPTFKI
jgi:predicted dehydrogenase